MRPNPPEPLSARPDVIRSKHVYGIWYGAIVGLTFSLFAWGMDAYALSTMNGLYPWLKFLTGVIPCMLVGGFAGWLSARVEKPVFSMVLWVAAAAVFAWLSVNLPLQIFPRVANLLDPQVESLLHYTYYEQFAFRFGVAYFWLAIFAALAGLLQIPLSDSAVFSASLFGKIAPLLVATALMAIAGSTMDSLNNELLRGPLSEMDATIQYFSEHRGEKIDPAVTRQMHLASLRTVEELVTPQRRLIISGYDETFGEVQVLVKFQEAWVECQVLYKQPYTCEKVAEVP